MYQRNIYSTLILLLMTLGVSAQYNIGIRAGLNQSKFVGPSEANATESFSLTGGFHFGAYFQYNINDNIGLRSEIIYNQTGSSYSFSSDDGYYMYRPVLSRGVYPNIAIVGLDSAPREDWIVLRDKTQIDINYSNSYLQFPQTVHLQLSNKFEIHAGAYFGVMLSPLGFGTMKFGEGDPFEKPYIFQQGLDFNFNTDDPAQYKSRTPVLLIVNGQDVDIPSAIGAYYFIEDADEDYTKRYSSIDYGVVGGISYYFNRGLYTSLRVDYGLADVTRTLGDISYQELQQGNVSVYNDDFDRNLNFSLSIGFKF